MNCLREARINLPASVVEKAIEKTREIDSEAALVFSGSRIDGLGNEKSDLDVYIITEFSSELDGRELFFACEGIKIEATIITIDGLRKHFESAAGKIAFECAENLPIYSALISHRLLTGLVVKPNKAFDALVSNYTQEALACNLRVFYTEQAVDRLENAFGTLDCQQYESSAFSMIRAISYALDGLLACKGDTNPVAKWRFSRAEKYLSNHKRTLSLYRSYIFPFLENKTLSFLQYIENGFALLRHIFDEQYRILLNVNGAWLSGYKKEHLAYLRLFRGNYYVVKKGAGVKVSKDVAKLWLRIPDEAIGKSGSQEIVPEVLKEKLALMVKHGLIKEELI